MITLWMMSIMLGMSIPAMSALSISKTRQNARFLTDKMTYELGLSMMQYNDVYEVNFDFINNVRYIMDDVVKGNDYAINRYYEYLDYRNEDLRWILSNSQYRQFIDTEYFYRPIYTTKSNWEFRIFNVYMDVKHFFFDKPKHYKSYNGEHFRSHFNNRSFYQNHRKDVYKHEVYRGNTKVNRKTNALKIKEDKHSKLKSNMNSNKNDKINQKSSNTRRNTNIKEKSKQTSKSNNSTRQNKTNNRSSENRNTNRGNR